MTTKEPKTRNLSVIYASALSKRFQPVGAAFFYAEASRKGKREFDSE
jgi:hypothetical protein